ncbi:MAG: type II toxin-antitoxin system VapC family toxin [Pirellulales bacterium]
MIVLDTDHLSILEYPERPQYQSLMEAMDRSTDGDFATTAVSLEEQLRAWLAAIHRTRKEHDQILYYSRLTALIGFFGRWTILPFNEPAADRFVAFRSQGIRIGTMDLKIAAIAMERDSLLLSANLRDFQQVPGLRVEDWLH